ncbi:MAG TPA: hypothetical protein VNO86_04075 [Candidatus Binatia bacterium]|nr:hypothetical protein [Candidatus Binatia bacterium]
MSGALGAQPASTASAQPARGADLAVTLRAAITIDRLGPQYAAYWGLMAQGSLPLAGMSQLLVEVSPSNLVFELGDVAFKRSPVRSAGMLVERDFGLLELHADRPDAVEEAKEAIVASLQRRSFAEVEPRMVSRQRLARITPDHSHLFNKVRRGSWALPDESLFIVEVSPAAYVYLLANEIEKASACRLVRVAGTGLFGRLIVSGTEAETEEAERVVDRVMAALRGGSVDGRTRRS